MKLKNLKYTLFTMPMVFVFSGCNISGNVKAYPPIQISKDTYTINSDYYGQKQALFAAAGKKCNSENRGMKPLRYDGYSIDFICMPFESAGYSQMKYKDENERTLNLNINK